MRFSEGCIKIRAELVPGFIAAGSGSLGGLLKDSGG